MRYSFSSSVIFIWLSISISFAATPLISVWEGAEGGEWNIQSNWVNNVIPVPLDPVGGPTASPYSVAQFSAYHTNPNLDSGVSVGCDMLRIGDTAAGSILTLNGATVNVSEYVYISYSSSEAGTLNINNGTLNTGARIPANGKLFVGRAGNGTLNIINGVLNVSGALSIADMAGSTGHVFLYGGAIYAADLLMNANGHLDIHNGTLILDGNDMPAVEGFIAAGKITAYSGAAGSLLLRDYNVTNTGKTTLRASIVSSKATNPSPGNDATNINPDLILSWTAGSGATSHNVYFGTTVPLVSQGSVTAAAFNPGLLVPNTIYYWQIDEVSGSGTTTGDIWSFTTTTGQPAVPNPANDTTGIGIHPVLSWTGALGATGHNVYFGTTNPPAALVSSNQGATTYDPGILVPRMTYFWRIEELYGVNCVLGPVWNFSVANTKASPGSSEVCPRNGDANMPVSGITLAWTAGEGAVSHDVYFGTTNPPAFAANQTATIYQLTAALEFNTTYYWRIDEHDSMGGITEGDVWSFTTGDPVGIYPYLTFKNDPTSSILVNWWNPAAQGDSSVDYGLTSSYGSTANVSTSTHFHHVEITGLNDNTLYHYRIRSSDGTVGSDNTFKTAPSAKDHQFTFAFYSDPRTTELDEGRIYSARQEALCNWMATQDIDFAIEGGDTVWEGATLRGMGKYWPDFFKYEQNLTKSKVVMHSLGGHEDQGGTIFYWNNFYTAAFPTNGAAGTNGLLYSFDYCNAHFVCLASYRVNWNTEAEWLREDLTAANARGAKWIFAYLHYPLYTTSGHLPRQPDIAALGPIFDEFHVNLVFQSHNHLYERFYPIDTYYDEASGLWTGKIATNGNAPVYITNGAGGAEFNSGDPSDTRLVSLYGLPSLNSTLITLVTVNQTGYWDLSGFPQSICSIRTVRNDTGQVIDNFDIYAQMRADDFNKDGITDMKDLRIFAAAWLDSGLWP